VQNPPLWVTCTTKSSVESPGLIPRNNQPPVSLSLVAELVLHAFPEKMQLYKKLGALWAHPQFEICKGAAELALIHSNFRVEHLLSLCPLHGDIQIKTLHASFALNTALPQASLN